MAGAATQEEEFMSDIGRVLIADDEELFLESTADLLRRAGYECDTASNGRDALALLSQHGYDLLIADIKMPGNSDLELAHEVEESETPLPIVFVTGYPSLHTAVEALELPVVGYLLKPLDLNDLFFQVRRGVERGRLLRTLRAEKERAQAWIDTLELTERSLLHRDDMARREALDVYLTTSHQQILASIADLHALMRETLAARKETPA